ncbi:SLC13 family permease [Hellea balneolensis]|uniref:SLC13 family permease n=1 Tax=Hellea balneolensis TaxID=287478 RepID=UPI000425847D|nr:SLC13 family permease [Hellea balneolensis]
MDSFTITASWQMWATMLIVLIAVWFYVRERYSIETISVGVIAALLIFFHFFSPPGSEGLDSSSLLSGFAAPALITIMALLVVGQGMFQTGALEGPIMSINNALDKSPRRTLFLVFAVAFAVSMFMNNTPVVVMFIPVLSAMSSRLRRSASRYMMPLSFMCILAGMTTLIGSSTNLLVNDVLQRSSDMSLGFFSQFSMGIVLAAIGAIYIILASPYLLPERKSLEKEVSESGQQYIAQIRVTENHPLKGTQPIAGLYPALKNVTVRMIQRGEKGLLPPFEHALQTGDVLIVAATRKSLSNLLSSSPRYLEGMLNIAGFHDESKTGENTEAIIISEAVIAPGSRMIGRNIEQVGFRRQTGCLVLGIQRRSRMIRKRMLEIRLEAGDVLLLFGYDADMRELRNNRDLLLLDWSKAELPDIRKSLFARIIFAGTIFAAATSFVPIEIAALSGALAMIMSGCLNIRQAVRALDMRIFLLIGAAFAMGLALENTGGAAYIGMKAVETFQPFGNHVLIAAVFLLIALMTNIISNSASALLFAPIALAISQQTGIDPIAMVMTVIFAANCSFATPIAYQTNLLVMGPGRYNFADFAKFGIPLIFLMWISFTLLVPLFFQI